MLKYNVVNFHLLDLCNYKCKHCFVNRQNNIVSLDKAKLVIDKIQDYFQSNGIDNGRINLAGGEPLLYPHLNELIDYIALKGIKISIISNGSFITNDFIHSISGKVEMIGLSLDSTDEDTLIKIGRCDSKVLSMENFVSIAKIIHDYNIKLKVNICVSKLNYQEDFHQILKIIKPDRLKIIRMSIENGVNNQSEVNELTAGEFLDFAEKYNGFNPVIEVNMNNNYLIIDSDLNVSTSNSHKVKNSIMDNSFEECIKKLDIIEYKYFERYNNESELNR